MIEKEHFYKNVPLKILEKNEFFDNFRIVKCRFYQCLLERKGTFLI